MPTTIALPELQRLLADSAHLVEVLPEDEYAAAHLPGAINIPLKRLAAETTRSLDKQRAVIVYCWDGL
jgi:rhodanese-related sulfurtransferase